MEYIRKHFGLEAAYNQRRSFHAFDPPREDSYTLTRFVVYELILFVSHFVRLQHKNTLPLRRQLTHSTPIHSLTTPTP